MFSGLVHLIPILVGFFAKLVALKSQDARVREELLIKGLSARTAVVEKAREHQTPASNAARRVILFFLVFAISLSMLGYVLFDVPIFVEETVKSREYLFGLIGGTERTVWTKIEGIPSFEEIFTWMTILIEFWFGSQIAKRA